MKETYHYEELGILDNANAMRLREHLAKNGQVNNIFISILYATGALMIAGAFILLAIHNWNDISSNARLALSFVPLAISVLFGLFALSKPRAQIWSEIAACLNIAGFALLISLISAEFNSLGSEHAFCMVLLILSLPTIFIFNSGLTAGTLVVITCLSVDFIYYQDWTLYFALLAMLAILLFTYFKDATPDIFKKIAMFVILICALILTAVEIPLYIDKEQQSSLWIASLASVLFPLAVLQNIKIKLRVPAFIIALVVIIALLVQFNYPLKNSDKFEFSPYIVLPALVLIVETILLIRQKAWAYLLAPIFFALTVFISLCPDNITTIKICANLIMTIFAISLFVRGLNLKSYTLMVIAELVLLLQGFLRFTDLSDNIFLRALLCAGMGVFLIVFNVILKKHISKNSAQKESE